MANIRYSHIAVGLGEADWPKLGYAVRGMKKKTVGRGKLPSLPITHPNLQGLLGVWQSMPNIFVGQMLEAAACIFFFGMLCLGEVVVLSGHHTTQLYISV